MAQAKSRKRVRSPPTESTGEAEPYNKAAAVTKDYEALRKGEALTMPPRQVDVKSVGPREAIAVIERMSWSAKEKDTYLHESYVRAVLGSCPNSLPQHESGMRRWLEWHKATHGTVDLAFPPRLPDLVAFADVFQCMGTYVNYLGSVRLACELWKLDVEVFKHPTLKRAKVSVEKRGDWTPRPKFFVRFALLQRLVYHARYVHNNESLAMLFLAAYGCMLRVPSEGMRAVAHAVCDHDACRTPVVKRYRGELAWFLPNVKITGHL